MMNNPVFQVKYAPVRKNNGDIYALRSQYSLIIPNMGILPSTEIKEISQLTNQEQSVFESILTAVCYNSKRLSQENIAFNWVSVGVPISVLKNNLIEMLDEVFTKERMDDELKKKLCLEFSSEILYEDQKYLLDTLIQLKMQGYILAINNFGDEYCPVMKLRGLPFDYVIMHPTVTSLLNDRNSISVTSTLVSFVRGTEASVIIINVDNKEEIGQGRRIGTEYYQPKEEIMDIDNILENKVLR